MDVQTGVRTLDSFTAEELDSAEIVIAYSGDDEKAQKALAAAEPQLVMINHGRYIQAWSSDNSMNVALVTALVMLTHEMDTEGTEEKAPINFGLSAVVPLTRIQRFLQLVSKAFIEVHRAADEGPVGWQSRFEPESMEFGVRAMMDVVCLHGREAIWSHYEGARAGSALERLLGRLRAAMGRGDEDDNELN